MDQRNTATVMTNQSEHVKEFHVRILLSYENAVLYLQMPSTRKALTSVGAELVARLAMLPGIEDLCVNRCSVRVTKGKAFTWMELYPSILDILE